jgi:glycosyltransferase involved in cell wall biosynthesis
MAMASADTIRGAAGSQLPETLLHVFPSFGIGGVPLRMTRVMNHLGKLYHHTIIALDNNFKSADHLAVEVEASLIPIRSGRQGAVRAALAAAFLLRRLRPDLLLTYNWGAIEWAIAHRLFPVARHIHLEAGFGKEEADTQLRRRVLCRRWALAHCHSVLVPSRRLDELARRVWNLPPELVSYVPNGVDVARFAAPARDAVPGFARRPGELVVGTLAPLRPEKNIGRLLRVFALVANSSESRLIIAGDGLERQALENLARELGIADRVIFTGQMVPESVLGTFDIFALSSDTEQMPNALLEAMAASRPVVAVDVGDVKSMVSEENRSFIVPRSDAEAFAGAIERLLHDPSARNVLGRANRARVVAEFSQERMFAAYADIFASAIRGNARQADSGPSTLGTSFISRHVAEP